MAKVIDDATLGILSQTDGDKSTEAFVRTVEASNAGKRDSYFGVLTKAGLPERGWDLIRVEKIVDETFVCDRCPMTDIQYLFIMTHPTRTGANYKELGVGCICAGWMFGEGREGLDKAAKLRSKWVTKLKKRKKKTEAEQLARVAADTLTYAAWGSRKYSAIQSRLSQDRRLQQWQNTCGDIARKRRIFNADRPDRVLQKMSLFVDKYIDFGPGSGWYTSKSGNTMFYQKEYRHTVYNKGGVYKIVTNRKDTNEATFHPEMFSNQDAAVMFIFYAYIEPSIL